MPFGSKPAPDSSSMPTRSASCSFERVKLIWRWAASACDPIMTPCIASLDMSEAAPSTSAASMAAIDTMLLR